MSNALKRGVSYTDKKNLRFSDLYRRLSFPRQAYLVNATS